MMWNMLVKEAKVFTQGTSLPKIPRLLLLTPQQGVTLFHRYEVIIVMNCYLCGQLNPNPSDWSCCISHIGP
jgi:hypothetical protein